MNKNKTKKYKFVAVNLLAQSQDVNFYANSLDNISKFAHNINIFFFFSSISFKTKFYFFSLFNFSLCDQLVQSSYVQLFSKSILKHGNLLKTNNFTLNSFFSFFFLFKSFDTFSVNFRAYYYLNFIKSYFNSNSKFFVNINLSLWWLVNFLDINFWVICALNDSKKDKNSEKYVTKIKAADNVLKKSKLTFKLIYLESLLFLNKNTEKRFMSVFFDLFFNYKLSSLYKKKIMVYKKLFV